MRRPQMVLSVARPLRRTIIDWVRRTSAPAGVPGAPTIGTATRSASQTCSITFTAPASDGGSPITGYTLTSSPGGLTGSGTASPVSVSGLTNGVAYTFTAVAHNANGTGPASAASNAATPATVPAAPVAPTAVAGDTEVDLQFPAPNDGGSAITSYTATSSPGNIQRTMTAAELMTQPLTVTGLTNGVAYTFTIVATNQYGNSAASPASNSVTPEGAVAGPFDSLYTAGWQPVSGTTVYATPALTEPAKSTGIANVSYTDPVYGTKVFRVSQPSDSPGNPTGKMRHEYSRRPPWNCDETRFMLLNGNGFMFAYDADTFARLQGGVTSTDAKQYAVGTNATHPKDGRDWTWHATDPNKIIFKSTADDLNFYEFDLVTKVLTTKFSFTGRLAAFGMGAAATVTTGGEGRPSNNGRYWGFMVKDSGGANLGYITYDMQTDTILGALVTSRSSNNVTMSSNGNYIIMSGPTGTSYETAAVASELTGVRAYTRDFSSFKQLHYWGSHADVAIDTLGREVYITLNQGGSNWNAIPTNSVFMIPCGGPEGPTMLVNLGANSSQWNSHYSGCSAPKRPGWTVLSMWDTAVRGTKEWLDNTVSLVELKANPRILRILDHRVTLRYDYWQEPHSNISGDGLRVMNAIAWDCNAASDVASAYMVGLPSWIYDAPAAPTNLLPNGTFDNANGWSLGTSCTVTGGKLWCNNNAANVTNSYALSLPAGTYKITYTLSDFTAGNVTVRLNSSGTVVSGAIRTITNGTFEDTLVAATPVTAFEVRVTRSGTAMDVKIDDIITIVAQ